MPFSPRLPFVLVVLAAVRTAPAVDLPPNASDEQKQQAQALADLGKRGTHAAVAEVKVTGTDGKSTLQTLCADADGRVLALVAPPRGYQGPAAAGTGEVQVYSADGKPVAHWPVPFHAHSINVSPDGVAYVAGDGKVARFDKAGNAVGAPFELPHIASLLQDEAGLRRRAEEQVKGEARRLADAAQTRKQFEDRVKALEAKPAAERSRTEARQLEQAKMLLESFAQQAAFERPRTVDDIVRATTSRMRVINGVAVSEKDVFVACGEPEGYGYAVWRLDRDLANPTRVIAGLRGCCGQIDIQCSGPDLLVAENTKHQFSKYDRDGKPIGSYGKKAAATDPEGFAGCCNPMNVRTTAAGGDVLTAESEGIVKRFSAAGEFRGVVGTVSIEGGCKNVAIGTSPDGDKVYFCDQPGSRFFVLARRPAAQ
jgi:hypothetical protein